MDDKKYSIILKHPLAFFILLIIFSPLFLLGLITLFSSIPWCWHISVGTNDGWLGFWGGYLGAIITIGGVFIQIRSERQSENDRYEHEKKEQQDKYERDKKAMKEQIKLQQIATFKRESLVALLVLMEEFHDIYESLQSNYEELNESISYYHLNKENGTDNLLSSSDKSNAKDFVFNMDMYCKEHKVHYSKEPVEEMRLKTIKFKINNSHFLPFMTNARYFADGKLIGSSLDRIVENLRSDFYVNNYIAESASFYSTYLNDDDLQNIVANINMIARNGLSQKVASIDFIAHKDFFEDVFKESMEMSDQYFLDME